MKMRGNIVSWRRMMLLLPLLLFSWVAKCDDVADSLYVDLWIECMRLDIISEDGLDIPSSYESRFVEKSMAIGYTREEAVVISNRYRTEVVDSVRSNYIFNIYCEYVSLADLRSALDYFDNDYGRAVLNRMRNPSDSALTAKMKDRMVRSISSMLVDGKMVEEKSLCPSSYLKKAKKYLEVSGQKDFSFSSFFEKKGNDRSARLISSYMDKNWIVLASDALYGLLPEADLDFINKFYATKVGKRFSKATEVIMYGVGDFLLWVDDEFEPYLRGQYEKNPPSFMKGLEKGVDFEDSLNG